MSKERHTPGPWSIGEQNGHGGIAIEAADHSVATVYLNLISSSRKWGEEHFNLAENAESVANAHLIAAAPDMLAALKGALTISEMCRPWPDEFGPEVRKALDNRFEAIRAAVRLAEGRSTLPST